MRSFGVVLRQEPSDEEIRPLVERMNGRWIGNGLDLALFEGWRSYVQLDREPLDNFLEASSSGEIASLEKKLGGAPTTILSLHYRSSEASLNLAERVALEILAEWGGTLDRDEGAW